VPLRKGRVPKIIVGARGHPETYVDPPLGGLVSLRSAARTPFRVRPPSPRFHHTPAGATESKGGGVEVNLPSGQRLGKDISNHIICRTVDKIKRAGFHNMANEVVSDVDVFCVRVVVVGGGENECGLVVAEHCGLSG